MNEKSKHVWEGIVSTFPTGWGGVNYLVGGEMGVDHEVAAVIMLSVGKTLRVTVEEVEPDEQ